MCTLIFKHFKCYSFVKIPKKIPPLCLAHFSYHCSLFSRWSGKAHLPSIPLNTHEHNFSLQSHLVRTSNNPFTWKIVIVPSLLPVPPLPQVRWNPPSPKIQRLNVGRMNGHFEKRKWLCQGFLLFLPWVQLSCDTSLSLQRNTYYWSFV